MIVLENVVKKFNNFTAVDNINLSIKRGEYLAVTGRSGSGKSTLLHLLGGLDKATAGKIFFNNKNIMDFSEQELSIFRNKEIGFIFQSFHLELSYTVYKNIELPLIIAGFEKKKREDKICKIATKLGIDSKLSNLAKTLSGGEKQRAAIARALVNEPNFILADEPCGNLDTLNAKFVLDLFDNLHKEGKTIVLVTHQNDDAKRAQRKIELLDGKIAYEN